MDAFDVVDWRRQVFALYAEVRGASDPQSGHAAWRERRDHLFATHPAAPLLPEDRAGFRGLPVADYDPAWRFEVDVLPVEPEPWDVTTGTDGVVRFERFGLVEVPDVGSLDVWRLTSYGGGLFVPVKDRTAGGPGAATGRGAICSTRSRAPTSGRRRARRLVDELLVLDFNFAYNPSCAYDPAWACPLAPPGNVVDVEVPVGERSTWG